MNQEQFRSLGIAPVFDNLFKNCWTVSRGLRPPPFAIRTSNMATSPALRKKQDHVAVDKAFLKKRIKACLLNDDYSGLLEAAMQVLEIDSHCSTGWLHTGVALLGMQGISTKTPFVETRSLSPEKRIHLNEALRALHTATTCQTSALTMAEIYVMKALARFSLGQLQGAYLDLQLALRHSPGFSLAMNLMQHSAMQKLKYSRIPAGEQD